jgi:hypothetical protein
MISITAIVEGALLMSLGRYYIVITRNMWSRSEEEVILPDVKIKYQ